jgi:hypothetical protein
MICKSGLKVKGSIPVIGFESFDDVNEKVILI